jgi:ribosomal protein S18 acetylase RimI-like enzyme
MLKKLLTDFTEKLPDNWTDKKTRSKGRFVRFEVKPAGQADVPALVSLLAEAYTEAGFTLDRGPTTDAFAFLLANPMLGCVWLARTQGEPDNMAVGLATLSVRFTMEHAGLSGYIDDLYVRTAFRRLGVGKNLLEALSAESRKRGYRSLQVEVSRSNNAALALYGRFGLHAATDDRILASGRLPAAGA